MAVPAILVRVLWLPADLDLIVTQSERWCVCQDKGLTGYSWVVHDEATKTPMFVLNAPGIQARGKNRLDQPFILWTQHCPYENPHRIF